MRSSFAPPLRSVKRVFLFKKPVSHPVLSPIPNWIQVCLWAETSPESRALSCRRTLHSGLSRSVTPDTASDLWRASCLNGSKPKSWNRAELPRSYLLTVLENVKAAQSNAVLFTSCCWRLSFPNTLETALPIGKLTKTTNMNCCLIKRKAAQWINKRTAPQGQDMNDKRAVVNVRRVMYGNRPTKVPVKGAQTNCTCDCHTSPKVTPAATLTTFCLIPNIFSLCSMKIPKRITFLLRIEMRSHFSVYWERAFCLPLDGEHLFRGGKVFVLCHLVWCAGEMGMKAIK